jgi:hypothetical protein
MKRFSTVLFDRAGDKVVQQWIAGDDEKAAAIRTGLQTLEHEFEEGSLLPTALFTLALSGDDNYDANFMTRQELRDNLDSYFKEGDLVNFEARMDELVANPEAKDYIIESGGMTAEITCSLR